MKFLVQLFLLSVLCIGLSSCEDDQDVVDSTIIGRSWTGDVGMLDDFGMSVISTFSFGADGFGEEVQRYRNGNIVIHSVFNGGGKIVIVETLY